MGRKKIRKTKETFGYEKVKSDATSKRAKVFLIKKSSLLNPRAD